MVEQVMKNNKIKKYERGLTKRTTHGGNMNKLSKRQISISIHIIIFNICNSNSI